MSKIQRNTSYNLLSKFGKKLSVKSCYKEQKEIVNNSDKKCDGCILVKAALVKAEICDKDAIKCFIILQFRSVFCWLIFLRNF